jgi:hypothetical protein
MARTVLPAGHWTFQLANAFLLLSYASPDVLFLRVVLLAAGFCFVMWGALVLSVAVDTVVWNGVFCVINGYRAAELAWARRPIRFEMAEHEEIYAEVFRPVGIGRVQFKRLMEQGLMRKLRCGSTFIEAGNDATNLTLVYKGSFSVISHPKDGRPSEKIGSVRPMQFVESPQWANMQVQRRKRAAAKKALLQRRKAGVSSGSFLAERLEDGTLASEDASLHGGALQAVEIDTVLEDDVRAASTVEVTFRAEEDVTIFTFPMEHLQEFLRKNPGLSAPLNAIVGADVAAKVGPR